MLEWILVHGSLIAFFILANAFFVAAEFALVSVRETRLEQLIVQNRPGARTALQLKHNIDEFLPAVQFGVTLAALALGGLGEPAVTDGLLAVAAHFHIHSPHLLLYAHTVAVILAFSLITYLEVLLGELVPKSLALQRAERIALAVSGPIDVFIRLTRPAVKLMNGSATLVLKLFRAPLRGETAAHSPEEIKLMATATRKVGMLPVEQEEMVHRAIELNQVSAAEIMTPRGKIFSLPANTSLETASARIIEEQHSRVPVYDPALGRDHIIGVVHSKDISRLMHFRAISGSVNKPSGITIRSIMREVLVIPETKPAVEILSEFKERRRLMAIVVDEFGSTLGLVTAEDVLEQLVGELEDEFDIGRSLQPLTVGGSMILDGTVSLRDLTTQLRWKLPREAGVETVAGILLAKLGHIPSPGEASIISNMRFVVESMDGNRIARVRVESLTQTELPLDNFQESE